MFSCEFCEIFKDTFFAEHLRVTVSEFIITLLILTAFPISLNAINFDCFSNVTEKQILLKLTLTLLFVAESAPKVIKIAN